jgi:hypothetical protein
VTHARNLQQHGSPTVEGGGVDDAKQRSELLERVNLSAIAPEEVVFWSGAGISFAAPTCAPGGIELVERALETFFEPDTLARIRDYYGALCLARTHPRLETVLDVIRRIHGLEALRNVLSDVRDRPPNTLHRFFADHLSLGGRHITANFDTCIEACGGDGVAHFHGSFIDGDDALGATLARIQRGFPLEITIRLHDLLFAGTCLLVFVGYSGSDAFDVEPFLRRLDANPLDGTAVLWISYADSDSLTISRDSSDIRVARHLELLEKAGADCFEVSGDPVVLLRTFAERWNLPAPGSGGSCVRAWAPPVVDGVARSRASLELWAMMGVHREIRRHFAEHPPRTPGELAIAAQTSWAGGRYREAARQWWAVFPRTDPVSRANAAERAGSVLWVQGRLLHAYLLLHRALARARREGVDGEPLWLLAEALGHVLVHMKRRPLLRRFVTDARKRRVLAYLDAAMPDEGYTSLGVHLDARLGGVQAALRSKASDRTSPITTFDEAEALKAMLSYRHADLRRRAEAGDLPTPDEYRRQRAHCLALGAFGDVPRIYTIPGAARAFPSGQLRQDLKGVELATWPKLLLRARFNRERKSRSKGCQVAR